MDPITTTALISGGASLLGSLFGSKSQAKNVNNTNEANLAIAQQNNQTQREIAQANNEMQLQALRENNQFNRESAIEMFNLENAYNTPEKQVERLVKAGLNPATMYNNGGLSAQSANGTAASAGSSGITPSMPSMTTPTMQTVPSVLNSMFGNMETLSRVASSLTKAGLDKAQSDKIRSLLSSELDNLVENTKNVQLKNNYQEMQNAFEKMFGFASRNKQLEKLTVESYKVYQEGVKAGLDGEVSKAEALFKKAQTILENSKNEQLQVQLPYVAKTMQEQISLLQEQQKTETSKQAANYSAASLDDARRDMTDTQRKQVELMMDDTLAIQRAIRNKEQIEVKKLYRTFEAQCQYLIGQGWLSKENANLVKEQAERAAKDNDIYWFDKGFGYLERIAKGVAAFIPFAGGKEATDNGYYNYYTPTWSNK